MAGSGLTPRFELGLVQFDALETRIGCSFGAWSGFILAGL